MKIEQDVKLDFQDVLLKPKRSTIQSRKDVDLSRHFSFKHSNRFWVGIPIISSNMSSVTTPAVAKQMSAHSMLSCLPKNKMNEFWTLDSAAIIPSIGLYDLPKYLNERVTSNFLCLDVPNGYIQEVIDQTKVIRDCLNETIILIVGNVATAEQTEALIFAGADIVKVGIGSGAACSTRIKTGVGVPQLSAVIECADAAHGIGGHIISDGGCTTPSDIVKAFSGGADFVMLGAMLSGTDEAGQEFYGMSSERANKEFAGGLKDYRASEGWELVLPSRGPIDRTLQDIKGGLRSACSYVGARRLKDLPKCATFVQVNRQINTSLLEYRV